MKEPRAELFDTCRQAALQTEDTLERMEGALAAEERRLASALGLAEASDVRLAGELRALAAAVKAARTREDDAERAALLREVQALTVPGFRAETVRTPWHVARAAAAARRRGACEAAKATLDEFVRASTALEERLAHLRGRLDALAARPAPLPPELEEESVLERALASVASAPPTPDAGPPPAPPPTPPLPPRASPTRVARATPQRRSHARRELVTRVDVDSDSNFYGGFSTDVSEGGLFVATIAYPAPGTSIDLRFTLPGGFSVEATGVVQWVREVNDATPEVMPGAGVRFVDLPDAAAQAIRAFVAQREPLFFVD